MRFLLKMLPQSNWIVLNPFRVERLTLLDLFFNAQM